MLTESSLIDLTRKKFQTWVTLDLDQLSQIFDDHGLSFNAEGKIDTKEELIKKMSAKTCLLKDFNFQNIIARVYETSAVVQGVGEFVFSKAGETQSANLNFLDVWIERETGWKLVSTHYNLVA
jgi:hypothetical protein